MATEEPFADLEQILMRWGEAGRVAASIFGGVPEVRPGDYGEDRLEMLAGGARLAMLRPEPDGSLSIERELPYELRESLYAAGLGSVLPDGDELRWRIPPDGVDEPIAVLRAVRDALVGEEFFDREP